MGVFMNCCFGCGQEGIFEFKSSQSKNFGKFRCSKHYRQCPVKRLEWAEQFKTLNPSLREDVKIKIGLKSKGRPSTRKGRTAKDDPRILSGDKHPSFGKTFSEEHRNRISQAKKGKALSEEHKTKIKNQTSGKNNPRYGKGWSEEQRIKWKETIRANNSLVGSNNPNWNPTLDRKSMSVYRSNKNLLKQDTRKLYNYEII